MTLTFFRLNQQRSGLPILPAPVVKFVKKEEQRYLPERGSKETVGVRAVDDHVPLPSTQRAALPVDS